MFKIGVTFFFNLKENVNQDDDEVIKLKKDLMILLHLK
jgi:hypothetical protein